MLESDFLNTLPDAGDTKKKARESVFLDTLPDEQKKTPWLRSPLAITEEEFLGGIKDIKEAWEEEIEKGSIPEKVWGGAKIGLGALRSVWSPITGVARGLIGTPATRLATEAGASPGLSKAIGTVAEIAPQFLIPAGASGRIAGGMGKVLPSLKKIAYGPQEISSMKNWPAVIKKLHKAIEEAIPLRAEQAAMYSKELGKRVGAVAGIGRGKLTGRAQYYAQLSKLKGELPKLGKEPRAAFESIAKKITGKDTDELLDLIEAVPHLSPLEKVAGKKGLLTEILAPHVGVVPTRSTIKILSEAFPEEFLKTLLNKRSLFQKAKDMGIELINVPRTVMASTDLSAAFRQGIFSAGRHPVLFGKSLGAQFKYALSPKAYRDLIKNIHERPNFLLAKEKGIAFTELGGLSGEEAYIGAKIAEKIPFFGRIIKGSNRAYTGFLNKFRMDLFDDFLRRNPNIVKNPKGMKQLTAYLNAATGRGNLAGSFKKAGPLLNGVLFSPRLMASRIKLLNPLYYVNPKLNPAVRKEALTSLISYVGTGMTMLGLASLAGAKVGLNPSSANFGKIIKGNTRFDIWGGFQQYARLIGQLVTGKMVSSTTGREYNLGEGYRPTTALDILYRFGESKENPVLSFVTSLIKGQNFFGDPMNVPEEALNRFIPMVVQDLYDIYKEGGLKDVPWATPAIFGVGLQTYGKRIPKMQVTSSGKLKIKPENIPGMSEDIINALRGKKATSIPEHLHAPLVKQYDIRSDIRYKKSKMRSEINKKKQKMMQEMIERMR